MQVPSYEDLLSDALAKAPQDVDTREGSLLYTAVAPVCAELAQAYIQLDAALDLLFFDTSQGQALDRLATQWGIQRQTATAAVCRAIFKNTSGAPFSVPVGMRLGYNGIFYKVLEKLEDGVFSLECETTGTVGNQVSGVLLPVDYLDDFGSAQLDGLITAGLDEETDDSLRQRLEDRVRAPAFGGNIADYQDKVKSISGVGAVKVTPGPDGAGTVGLTILDDSFSPASSELVEMVQAAADPGENGKGFAPIGHRVTVAAAVPKTVDLTAAVTFQDGSQSDDMESAIRNAAEDYFLELRREWERSAKTVVRLSKVVMAILEIDGVLDAVSVTLNGTAANLEIAELEVPILGTLEITIS